MGRPTAGPALEIVGVIGATESYESYAAVRRVVTNPEAIEGMAKLGATPAAASAADFGKLVASEVESWGRVVKAANISME